MSSPARLMAAGMAAPLANQLGTPSTPAAGLVGTGATKAAAVALIAGLNVIATVASAGVAAFQLPLSEASPPVIIINGGASPALVFAAGTTETINALSAAASFSVTNGKTAIFWPGKKNSVTPATGLWAVTLSA